MGVEGEEWDEVRGGGGGGGVLLVDKVEMGARKKKKKRKLGPLAGAALPRRVQRA